MTRTKIIATIGPSSSTPAILRKMMRAGMDVCRLNFSHGTREEHLRRIEIIHHLNKTSGRHLRILQDLEGHRIRVGRFTGLPGKQMTLRKKQVVFFSNKPGALEAAVIPFDYPGSLADFKAGQLIYIDDGLICVRVLGRSKRCLKTEVVVPGVVKEHKGINIPGLKLKFHDITPKDQQDIRFGLRHQVDFIAQSFVRNKKDMLGIRRFIGNGRAPRLIAKIENREGITNIDGILEASDGIMVARGDLGVSLPIFEVPVIQKIIIKKCLAKKKFVITATQMLESMTERIRPTRAEVSDVANAIIDGSHYVMLSGETAAGLYPVESVAMMNHIIRHTEQFINANQGR